MITDPSYRFLKLAGHGFYNHLTDEKYIRRKYRAVFGSEPDLKDPKTFNEKMQWLKLYHRKQRQINMVNKLTVKDAVSQAIGRRHVTETYGAWPSFDRIDFEMLPDAFVLKCTHDSGGIVICRDKNTLDMEAARKKLEKALKTDYYLKSREWPYRYVKPLIMAEEYLESGDGGDLKDYKFFCFNGKPEFVLVCADRFNGSGLKENFYDLDWNLMELTRPAHGNGPAVKRPETLEEMAGYAAMLAKDEPFVRVDFYDVDGRVYFGEVTYFPASGFEPFAPEGWDEKLGSMITLPEKKEGKASE